MLEQLTHLLHDLWFDWPENGFHPEDGKLSITFEGSDQFLGRNRVPRFRLTIHDVAYVHVKGNPDVLPKQEELNEFIYKPAERVLILKNCLATEIHCKVNDLYLELEELQ